MEVKYTLKWNRIRNAQNRENDIVLLEKHCDISILCVSYAFSVQGVFDFQPKGLIFKSKVLKTGIFIQSSYLGPDISLGSIPI